MAHYAFIDDSNIVVEVITGKDEAELIEGLTTEEWYGNYRGLKCVRTSFNGKIRFNYAGIGYSYDPIDDAFIAPVPCEHDSLLLNNAKRWECSECEEIAREAMAK
jgi:hypothetical protein